MSRMAVLYMGIDGQTQKISYRIDSLFSLAGHDVFICPLNGLPRDFQLSNYDVVVIGCSVRYGKHHKLCYQFIQKHHDQLNSMASYFFSVNLTARKPERRSVKDNPYLQKFLRQIQWAPMKTEVFAGALLYTKYGWLDKQLIRFIMRLTGGPTDLTQDTEFTDWNRVDEFATTIVKSLPTFVDIVE